MENPFLRNLLTKYSPEREDAKNNLADFVKAQELFETLFFFLCLTPSFFKQYFLILAVLGLHIHITFKANSPAAHKRQLSKKAMK